MKTNIRNLLKLGLIIAIIICCFSCQEFMPSKAKTSINIKEYKGVIMVGRQPTFGMSNEPIGTYVISFRKGDSIWSEIYRKEVLQSFELGDTIK